MNLPNKLTMGRLVLTVFFVAALSLEIPYGKTIALMLFLAAAITDYFDGAIARKHGLVTNFGKLMDPLADKVLIAAALILLVDHDLIWGWTVVVVIAREFLVTGLRLLAASEGIVVAAEKLGKWKTTIQIVTVVYCLLYLASIEGVLSALTPIFSNHLTGLAGLGRGLEIAMTLLTLWSGVGYLKKNRRLLASG